MVTNDDGPIRDHSDKSPLEGQRGSLDSLDSDKKSCLIDEYKGMNMTRNVQERNSSHQDISIQRDTLAREETQLWIKDDDDEGPS